MVLSKSIAVRVQRGTHVSAITRIPVGVQVEGPIQSTNPVELSHELTIREHGSNAGLFANIMAHAPNREVGTLPVCRVARCNDEPRRAVVGN